MSNKEFNGWGYTCHKGSGKKMVAILAIDVAGLGLQNSINWQKSTGSLPGYAGEVADFIKEETFYVAEAAKVIEGFAEAKVYHTTQFATYDFTVFGEQNASEAKKADSGNRLGSMMFKLA
jgi:hypothetical protein